MRWNWNRRGKTRKREKEIYGDGKGVEKMRSRQWNTKEGKKNRSN
jgi:hypothetical protein